MPKKGYKQTKGHKRKNTKFPTKKLVLDENLAYILGVIEGDGSISIKGGEIELSVIDKDFALAFKKALEEWVGLEFNVRMKFYEKETVPYQVRLSSVYIIGYLKNFDINKIKTSKKYEKMFLRGMYDSEGCVNDDTKTIKLSNNDKPLLQLCKDLLSNLGIESNKIGISVKKGSIATFPSGTDFTSKVDNYEFAIGKKENLIKFRDLVGFNIRRKQNKLIKMINSYLTKEHLYFIKSLPNHKRKNWKKEWQKQINFSI